MKEQLYCAGRFIFISASAQDKKEVKVSNKTKKELAKLYPNVKDVNGLHTRITPKALSFKKGNKLLRYLRQINYLLQD